MSLDFAIAILRKNTQDGRKTLETKLDAVEGKPGNIEAEVLLFHVAQFMIGNQRPMRELVEKTEHCMAVGDEGCGSASKC